MIDLQKVEIDIYNSMKNLNINYMPTPKELKSNGFGSLDSRIQKTGGYIFWREKLNLKKKFYNHIWNEERIKSELLVISNQLGYMPTKGYLKSNNRMDLASAIEKDGGYIHWKEKLNLKQKETKQSKKKENKPIKQKIPKWNEDIIIEEILKIKLSLNLFRMPTVNEVKNNFGNSLVSAITKCGGFKYFANKLNLPLKKSETKLGQDFEISIGRILEEKKYKVTQMSTLFPYDILINDCLKIDAKVAKRYNLHGNNYCTFGINKDYQTCDLYIFQCLDENENVLYTFIIPSHLVKQKSVSINLDNPNKYYKFMDRWDLIEKYIDFLTNI